MPFLGDQDDTLESLRRILDAPQPAKERLEAVMDLMGLYDGWSTPSVMELMRHRHRHVALQCWNDLLTLLLAAQSGWTVPEPSRTDGDIFLIPVLKQGQSTHALIADYRAAAVAVTLRHARALTGLPKSEYSSDPGGLDVFWLDRIHALHSGDRPCRLDRAPDLYLTGDDALFQNSCPFWLGNHVRLLTCLSQDARKLLTRIELTSHQRLKIAGEASARGCPAP